MGLLQSAADFFWGGSVMGGQELSEATKGLFNTEVQDHAQGLLAGVFPYGTPPKRGTRELLQSYRQHPWVNSVTRKIALDVAGTPLRLLAPARKSNRGKAYRIRDARGAVRKNLTDHALQAGELREIEVHPFLDLMRTWNPALGGHASRMIVQIYQDLKGEAFGVKELNPIGQPVELWPIPPHWVIMTPAYKMPFFRVSWMGWNRQLDEDLVAWLRSPDPENPYWRGVGLGDALGDEIDIDRFAQQHLKSWFYNRALPDAIVSVKGLKSRERAKEYEEELRSKHQGVGKGYQIHVASDDVTVHELGQTFKEQQMTETRAMQRDTIIQAFNVPPEAMGILEHSNRATIESAFFFYAIGVLCPRLDVFCDQMQPLAEGFDESLICDYISPVPDDHEFKQKVYAVSPWAFSQNEVRKLAGDQPVPGGDDKFPPMPSGGGGGLFGDPAGGGKEGEGDDSKGGKGKKKPKKDDEDEPDGKSVQAPGQAKAVNVDVLNILDHLRPDRLSDATDGPFRAELEAWGKRVLSELGSDATFDMRNPLIRRQIEQLAGSRISGINRTTRDALRDTLSEGVAVGASVDELKARVKEVFDAAEGWRAEMIARTEVVGASNNANLAAFAMSGVVEAKEWLSVQDAETRDSHASLDGQVRQLGDRFVASNGHSADCPGAFGIAEEDVNCRCSVLPVVRKDEDDKAAGDNRAAAFLAHENARKPFTEAMRKAFAAGFAKQRADVLAALA